MLTTFNKESLTEKLAEDFSKYATPTSEQIQSLKEKIVVPFLNRLDPSEQIMWFHLKKPFLLPGRYSMIDNAVTKTETKKFLDLFSWKAYRIYFLTNKRLIILSAIDWLEKQEVKTYNLSEMSYIIVGKMYNPSIELNNVEAFGYITKDSQYDFIEIDKESKKNLIDVLKSLDPKKSYHLSLEDIGLLDFFSKQKYKHKIR